MRQFGLNPGAINPPFGHEGMLSEVNAVVKRNRQRARPLLPYICRTASTPARSRVWPSDVTMVFVQV